MDAIPSQQLSPQTVGNEFVRQYYTLLSKAPNHLHRFYNNYSSYTHGDSQLVVGQRDIQNRIQQLDFKDCQANIIRVDAQAAPCDGVVVQVSGELSNDGQPMRRFFQTFVLAPQGWKKYYVHNDIFSYQDLRHAEEQDQNTEQLDNPEIQMRDQAVQISCNVVNLNQGENEQDQNEEQVWEPGLQLVDQEVQVSCHMVSLDRDEQDQNKEQAEEPKVQMMDQAVQAEYYLVPADQDLYKEDMQHQNEKPDIQMVDEAVQVACDMVSKHTQPESQVTFEKTSSAASQTVELSLQPQLMSNGMTNRRTCPLEQQKPRGTPADFEESPQFIQPQRQKQQPQFTVTQKEQRESLPQKQLLFSESLGGQLGAAQTNINNKRDGKSLISIELDISIYLVDKS